MGIYNRHNYVLCMKLSFARVQVLYDHAIGRIFKGGWKLLKRP